MDIPRKGAARTRLIRRIILLAIVAIAVPLITLGLRRMQPAAQSVEFSTLWPDTVKRGPMIRNVRGLGKLVPEDVLWIPATADGRVERIYVQPGQQVKADTVILELTNPDLQNQMVAAEYDWKAAQANYDNLQVTLESQRLTQEAVVTKAQSDYHEARLQAEADTELGKLGLKPALQVQLSQVTAANLSSQQKIEKQRLDINADSVKAQLAAQKVLVDQKKAAYELQKSHVEELKVRAGTDGVLLQLGAGTPTGGATTATNVTTLEEGQKVIAGAILAKVADTRKLKAELQIAETQAKDIQFGLEASVDTRNGIIPGKVMRIDPAPVNGTVAVDVKLTGALPPGARPDLSVDGTIDLERIPDVLYMGRPVFGQEGSTVTLFKIDPDGNGAIRVQVKLGRASVTAIEILEGLRVGDRVILSDMSAYDGQNRIRFN
ncbi:MAG TPA: HlyD family efflux transporter periplasmic adaptor subunit [Bryobacterales bacterium]|nr:HlyD family efflux transporter periplasmic adaptor subunit [Bryobacterales bacterium]